MRQGLEQARQAAAGPPPGPAGGMFGPAFMGRLALNPETRGYMAQPDFMAMLQALGRDPSQMTACGPASGDAPAG
jgi:stress-induced-phosphoprotein 1